MTDSISWSPLGTDTLKIRSPLLPTIQGNIFVTRSIFAESLRPSGPEAGLMAGIASSSQLIAILKLSTGKIAKGRKI